MAGYNISLRDVEQKFLDSAIAKIKWSLEKLFKKQKITEMEMQNILRPHSINNRSEGRVTEFRSRYRGCS